MQPHKIIMLCLLLAFNAWSVNAQTTGPAAADTTAAKEKNHLITGLLYHSGLNYYGRVDSLKSTAILPYLGVSFKNGLFLTSTFVFTNNATGTEYAATLLQAGYNFKNEKGNWVGTLSASGFLYKEQSRLPQSAVKGTGNISITNINKVLNLTFGADAKFSDQVDFGAMASIDHIIRTGKIFGNDLIVFDPTAAVYAGSQNFTKTYYEKKKFLLFSAGEEAITTNSKRFNVLAYELSIPVIYARGKCNLIFNPAYVLPQHLITVPGNPAASETGGDMFYFTTGVKLIF